MDSIAIIILLTSVATQITSIGTVVSLGILNETLQLPAMTAACSAIASLSAGLFYRLCLINVSSRVLFRSLIQSLLLQLFLDGMLVKQFSHQNFWFFLFLIKTGALMLFNSVLLGALRDIQSSDTARYLKLLQFASGVGLIVTLTATPLAVETCGIGILFVLDGLLLAPCLLLFLTKAHLRSSLAPDENRDPKSHFSSAHAEMQPTNQFSLYQIPLSLFLSFLVIGAFHSVEVPLLKSLQLNNIQIGLILGTSGVGHSLGSLFFSADFLKKVQFKTLAVLQISCILLSLVYFRCLNLVSAFTVVMTLTILNCGMLISSMAIVQNSSKARERINLQFLNKIGSNSGILIASILAVIAQNLTVAQYYFEVTGTLALLVISLLVIRNKPRAAILTTFVALYFMCSFPVLASEVRTFKVVIRQKVDITSPYEILNTSQALVLRQAFETLYQFGTDNSLRPLLVESHLISKNGKEIKLRFRKNTFFSDGSTLTAKDVKSSLLRVIEKQGKELGWALESLEGYSNYVENSTKGNLYRLGITVLDQNTLVLKLTRTSPLLMQALATPYFAIFKDSKSGPIGTGSYFLKKNETGHVLAIHRHKPSSNAIGPEVIEFLPESDDNKRMKLVQNGEVDLIEWPNWSGAPPTRYSQYPINHLQTAILLANRKILGKSACDELMLVSDEIKERHLFGLRRIQIGVPLFWKIFSDRSETTPYRTSWISTEHPREILFSQSASVYQESDRKALAQSLKSKHFSVTFKEVPYSDFVTRLKSGQFDFALAGFLPDYLDPDALLYPMLHSGELFNYTRYSNPKIDALLEKARKLDDSVGRAQLYKEAFSFTSRECFMNVLGSQPSKVLLRKNWSAPIIGALGLHTLDLSTLKQEVENGK